LLVFADSTYQQYLPEEELALLLPDTYEIVGADGLSLALTQGYRTLISFHGPYFPKAAWPDLVRFLEGGGNLALFGGAPFALPVDEAGKIEPEQYAYAQTLNLGPSFLIDLPSATLSMHATDEAFFLHDEAFFFDAQNLGRFWACYPKLTQATLHPEETGSSGTLDTLLISLVFVQDASTAVPYATPFLLLEQQEGRFRGGRWLISGWEPASVESWHNNAGVISRMIALTDEGAQPVFLRPELACYRPPETPTLLVTASINRPLTATVTLQAAGVATDMTVAHLDLSPSPVPQLVRLPLAHTHTPGLYTVVMIWQSSSGMQLKQETGVWIWDDALVTATQGQRLTAGRDYFYQGEALFPLFGTTYMDSRVQRHFLTLPNSARWDRDFVAMAATGVNTLRTGIWSGWRDLVLVPGNGNEAMLRALDAFVMTACVHQMQVIFTFFAFFPPLFEGVNPWLDPRSLRGQQALIALIVQRYAEVEILSWDLINEPSFGDPQAIFTLRPIPNGDIYEQKAFRGWLQQRYTLNELQTRWHLTPFDIPTWNSVPVPAGTSYGTHVRDVTARNMLMIEDFTYFAQDMFAQWAALMYSTIRAAGSSTLVGVGQDESGARAAPQFYAPSVDYTTTHPWWNNDDLLWDMLLDKTVSKPNIVQETGVMLVRDIDGGPLRSEAANAMLLERKLYMGLAARSAGMIQWLWHTNAYMMSDNENSIGLIRADGSAKPEYDVMIEFGKLMQHIGTNLVEAEEMPSVWLVIPYTQWFIRPELGTEATQRAVRVLGYDFGVVPQIVGEQQLAALLTVPRRPATVLVPSVHMFSRQGWEILHRYVYEGGRLYVSGLLTRDEHDLPTGKLWNCLPSNESKGSPVHRYELLEDSSNELYCLFEHDKIGYVKKAHNFVHTLREGAGTLIWCGIPIELAAVNGGIHQVYQQVLGISSRREGQQSPVLIRSLPIRQGSISILISEANTVQLVSVGEMTFAIAPGRAGAVVQRGQELMIFGGVTLAAVSE
jgi:hypothetical protein